jgi:hypothetical protein
LINGFNDLINASFCPWVFANPAAAGKIQGTIDFDEVDVQIGQVLGPSGVIKAPVSGLYFLAMRGFGYTTDTHEVEGKQLTCTLLNQWPYSVPVAGCERENRSLYLTSAVYNDCSMHTVC